MDDKRFDALTRALAGGASRRSVLKGLFGGLFGAAAVATRLDSASAQASCTVNEECQTGLFCRDDFCDLSGGSPGVCAGSWREGCCETEAECQDDNPCTDLTCNTETHECESTWRENCCTDTDLHCVDDNPCTNLVCNTDTNLCESTWEPNCCTDPELHCGTPPDVCTEYICNSANECEVNGGCPPGETCCDVDGIGIDCVNLLAPDDQYCGECGNACDPSETCVDGTCQSTTTTGEPTTTTSACIARVECENVQHVVNCPEICPPGSFPGSNRALEGVCCTGNGTCCSNSCTNGVCDGVVPTTTTTGDPTTTTTTSEPTTTTAAPLYDLPIYKSDGSQLIDGACFTLYAGACGPTGDAVRSEQCVAAIGTGGGADGRTIFEDLPAGTYCVVESTVPTGYDGGGPVTVNLPQNSTGWTVINTLQPTTTTTEPICLEDGAYCSSDDQCCNGCCNENSAIGTPPNRYCYCETCGTFGDSCGDSPITFAEGARQLDCCEGLLCCHGEAPSDSDDDDEVVYGNEAMYCAQCCNDHHCGKGYHCCHGRCISDDYCCSDYDCGDCEECRYIDGYGYGYCEPTGVPFGEYCGYDIQSSEGGSPQLDCCDGLVCCDVDKDGNRCFECCGDWDCPKGSECKHGVCEHECKHDKECPDGTCCCKSGHCSKHCCKDKPHKHGKKPHDKDDKGGPAVDTLPSTGSGDTAAGAGWLGAAALGAAAYVVGKTVRDGAQPEAEAQPEE